MAFIPIILDEIHIFMVKSQHFHGEVPISMVPPDLVFQVYPESCAVSDGCVELSWLELQGLSLAVASHVQQQMEAAVGWKLLIFRWVFIDFFGYGSIPINTIFSGMNIHLPAILGFTRYQGFDPSPFVFEGLLWGI
jgi:hypothetical protein